MPVTFTEKDHRYTSHKGEVYTSVTTFLKKFTPPFDADYWSAYKALKNVLSAKGEWDDYKAKAGGWENVVVFARVIDKTFPYRKEVIQEKNAILQMWEENKQDALRRGTLYHKTKEAAVKNSIVYTSDMKEIPVFENTDILVEQNFNEDGLYPELLIYNDDWHLAGQADWVMKRGRVIDIKDYKTSKTIDKEAFQNSTLLYPVSHLPNSNFHIYSLQLSMYAAMLEAKGYEIGKLSIEHVDKHTHKTIELYPVEYLKREVNLLIEEHIRGLKKKR